MPLFDVLSASNNKAYQCILMQTNIGYFKSKIFTIGGGFDAVELCHKILYNASSASMA